MLSREENLKNAKKQKRLDKLFGPGYFFFPVKTTLNAINAYREAEVFSFEQLKIYLERWSRKLKVDFATVSVQKKYDGVSCFLHYKNGKSWVFTDNGTEVTDRMNFFLEKLPYEGEFIILGELVGWIRGKHLGRENVAGLLTSKEKSPLLAKLTWCMYDLLWLDGKDLHKEPYRDRYTQLKQKFKFKYSLLTRYHPGFNLAPTFVCSDFQSTKKSIKVVADPPESEGAMLKLWDGFPYELDGTTSEELKFKKYAEGHFVVLSKRLIKGAKKTYAYVIGVLVLPSEREKVQEKFLAQLPGKKEEYLKCGKTFNTNIVAKVGDVITVKFHNLFVHYDDNHKLRMGVYEPRVYENRSVLNKNEQPDTVTSLIQIGEEANLLAEKSMYIQKAASVFLDYPPAGKKFGYVIQEHFRGRTAHADFRILHPSKKFLIGWTLMNQMPVAIKNPVLSLSDAKQALETLPWKFNPKTGEFIVRETHGGTKKLASIESVQKKPEPSEWLTIEGVSPIGSPGSTKNYPGVFLICAKGFLEYGYQAPHFHEYFVYNKNWDGGGARLVFRMLGSQFSSKTVLDYLTSEGILLDQYEHIIPEGFEVSRDESFVYKVLPPSEEQEVRSPVVWLMIKSLDQVPYVLSKRAVEKKRLPPYGASALPVKVQSRIPKEYMYWRIRDRQKALETRDELVSNLKNLKIGFDDIFKKSTTVFKSGSEKFVLKHRFWKGQHVVRWGVSQEFWDLYYTNGKKILRFELFDDPLTSNSCAARFYQATREEMNFEGELPPNTKLNPNKELNAHTEIVDKGTLEILEDKLQSKVLRVSGKSFKGRIKLTLDEGTKIWLFQYLT